MSFRIVVTEVLDSTINPGGADAHEVERYRQTVDVIDLPKLIAVINAKPRKPRERKAKA